eukprot:2303531-Pyramimonas_sp.AAC.2
MRAHIASLECSSVALVHVLHVAGTSHGLSDMYDLRVKFVNRWGTLNDCVYSVYWFDTLPLGPPDAHPSHLVLINVVFSAECATLNRVHINSITPEEFFNTYVAQRRPVVIEGYLQEDAHAGNLHKWKSDSYLLDKAGDAQVKSHPQTRLARLAASTTDYSVNITPEANVTSMPTKCSARHSLYTTAHASNPKTLKAPQVRVEVRESTAHGFAARRYVPMKFRKFMKGFAARDELQYLTTEA